MKIFRNRDWSVGFYFAVLLLLSSNVLLASGPWDLAGRIGIGGFSSRSGRGSAYSERYEFGFVTLCGDSGIFSMGAEGAYHHLRFDERLNTDEGTVGLIVLPTTVAGPARLYEFSVIFRLTAPISFPIKPFLSVCPGYYAASYPNEVHNYLENGLATRRVAEAATVSGAFVCIDLGIQVDLVAALHLDVRTYLSFGGDGYGGVTIGMGTSL